MKAILLVQENRSTAVSPTYLEDKLKAFYANGQSQSDFEVNDAPVLIDERNHPQLDPAILRKIKVGTDCVVRQLRPLFHLENNEHIESDRFGYLKAAFRVYPAGTVLLTRKTTFATFYIVFPDIKAMHHVDSDSSGGLVEIQEDGHAIYPIPPKQSINTASLLRAGASEYTWTRVNPTSTTRIEASWSGPKKPADAGIWWALYSGVMPSWGNLKDYNGGWHWLSEKGEDLPREGSKVLSVGMSSGAIYTLALFRDKWDLMDFQQFTAP